MKKNSIIGIIGAIDAEIANLKQSAKVFKSTVIAGMEFNEGTLGNKKVVIVKCGMGKVNAGICAHTLINHFDCDTIINTGVAGSLDNRLDIGDIVVSVDAVQHDFDVEPIGFKKGEIPYTGLYAFKADEKLKEMAIQAVKESTDINVYEGRICSGDQFISSLEQKETITGNYGGLCCEMEGAAIAQTCYLNGVPFVIIRAVSDKADGTGGADFHEFSAVTAIRCSNIVKYMIENME